MALVLRSQKTTPLTFEEMDGNFTDLNGRATTVEATYVKTVNGVSASSNALTLTSANITEGSNLYYTDARSRAAISVTDAGGDGSLSYNSSTGVITYTGPSAAEVRAHFTAGEGIDISSGVVSGEDATVSNKGIASFATANFTVASGAVSSKNITAGSDSGTAAVTLGGTLTFTGGEGIDTSATGAAVTIAAEEASSSNKGVASFSSDHFTVSSGAVTIKTDGIDDTLIDFGTGANQVNTADVPELTNLYYTNARADARIAAATLNAVSDVTYSSPTTNHVLTWTGSAWEAAEAPGASGGEANTAINTAVADSVGIFKDKAGTQLRFRSLKGDSNVALTQNTDDVTISLSSSPEFGNLKINSAANTIENTSTNANIELKPNGTGIVNVQGALTATGNITGTLATAAQTNITSVGALNGLTIASSQTVSMGSNKITNVTDPVGAQDAATKNYVDSAFTSGTTIFTLQADSGSNDAIETGDTIDFEGTSNEVETAVTNNKITIGLPDDVTIGNNLTVTGAITGQVDFDQLKITGNKLESSVSNADLTLDANGTGHINASANQIQNVLDPTGNQHAATKAYVDSSISSLNSDKIEEGNSSVEVVDSGTGTVTITVDGNAEQTIVAASTTFGGNIIIPDAGTIGSASDTDAMNISSAGVIELTGGILAIKNGGARSVARFYCETSNAHYAQIQAPAHADFAGNVTLTLPATTDTLVGKTTTDTLTNKTLTSPVIAAATISATSNTVGGKIKFMEGTDNGTNGVTLVGAAATADVDVVLPSTAGTLALQNEDTTGTAAIATTVTLADEGTDATCFPTFSTAATGNQGLKTDSVLTYNSTNGTLGATTFSGVATSAQYADLAERYIPDAEYPPGTVLTVGGGAEVTYCRTDSIPAGVVSTAPAYLMNSELPNGVAVALVGRVPVRTVGSVIKGQLVYADNMGVASATAEGERVGIALETNEDAGEKLVECMLKV